MKRIAVYAGSFDPPTLGHLDVLTRAAPLFDRVVLAVAGNSKKIPLFTEKERLAMIQVVLKDFNLDTKCEVKVCSGLIVDFCRELKAKILIRGLRATSDFDGEFQMATMNKLLAPEIETLHMMTDQKYFFLSSSLVKEVLSHGGNLDALVPKHVSKKLKERLRDSTKNRRK